MRRFLRGGRQTDDAGSPPARGRQSSNSSCLYGDAVSSCPRAKRGPLQLVVLAKARTQRRCPSWNGQPSEGEAPPTSCRPREGEDPVSLSVVERATQRRRVPLQLVVLAKARTQRRCPSWNGEPSEGEAPPTSCRPREGEDPASLSVLERATQRRRVPPHPVVLAKARTQRRCPGRGTGNPAKASTPQHPVVLAKARTQRRCP